LERRICRERSQRRAALCYATHATIKESGINTCPLKVQDVKKKWQRETVNIRNSKPRANQKGRDRNAKKRKLTEGRVKSFKTMTRRHRRQNPRALKKKVRGEYGESLGGSLYSKQARYFKTEGHKTSRGKKKLQISRQAVGKSMRGGVGREEVSS